MKRGVSDTGKVANDVEVEQVRPLPKIPASDNELIGMSFVTRAELNAVFILLFLA